MTARTDRSDPSRYSPAYAMGIPRGGSRVAEGDALAGARERIFASVEVGSRNRAAIEFLGVWERVNNPNFNYGEFAIIKSQAGLNSYKLSAKEWMEKI